MGQTTYANGGGIAYQGSRGTSVVFPDVCLTPIGNAVVPIPYPNIGKSQDTIDGPKSVIVDGKMPMVKGAQHAPPCESKKYRNTHRKTDTTPKERPRWKMAKHPQQQKYP